MSRFFPWIALLKYPRVEEELNKLMPSKRTGKNGPLWCIVVEIK
jgi:hypothetical protein